MTNYKIGVQDEPNKKQHSKTKGVHEEKIGNHNTTKHDVTTTSAKMKISRSSFRLKTQATTFVETKVSDGLKSR